MKKNIITTAATIITSAMVFLTSTPITSFAAGNITIDQAKQIALNNAGLKANQVTFVKEGTEIDHQDPPLTPKTLQPYSTPQKKILF